MSRRVRSSLNREIDEFAEDLHAADGLTAFGLGDGCQKRPLFSRIEPKLLVGFGRVIVTIAPSSSGSPSTWAFPDTTSSVTDFME